LGVISRQSTFNSAKSAKKAMNLSEQNRFFFKNFLQSVIWSSFVELDKLYLSMPDEKKKHQSKRRKADLKSRVNKNLMRSLNKLCKILHKEMYVVILFIL
jgi:hypothetical protein